MPPKKNSAFMMFVNEWRNSRPDGRQMSLQQAVSRGGDIWKDMTDQERGPYISAAKNADVESRAQRERLNCHGQALTLVEREQREAAESETRMKRQIERMVMESKRAHDLENAKFIFGAFNFFTKAVNSDVYIPAEFAACRFSLMDGVHSIYSTMINPGQLIFGQGSDTHHHCSTTHQLPVPPNALGESNMGKLYSHIVEYLAKCIDGNDKPIVVFTTPDQMPVVKACFRYLASYLDDESGSSMEASRTIEVYDIHYLFYILKKEVMDVSGIVNEKINKFVTDAYFTRDFYEFQGGIACQFHEEHDRGKYCTQSMVTRWSYQFADYMCGDLAIPVRPGKHIPPHSKPNFTVIPPASESCNTSIASYYSLPGAREIKKENGTAGEAASTRNTSPSGSRKSGKSAASYVPTDHTAFASDLSAQEDFPSLDGRRAKSRRPAADAAASTERPQKNVVPEHLMSAWNLPNNSFSLDDFTDEFSLNRSGNRSRKSGPRF